MPEDPAPSAVLEPRPGGSLAEACSARDLRAMLAAFGTDDARLHLRVARWLARYAEAQGLGAGALRSLAGPWHENVACLLAQELSHYETMFLGRDPRDGTPLDATWHRVWGQAGQVSAQAKERLRSLVAALPESVSICEVGSFIGRGSTRAFVEAFRDFTKEGTITCVDPWTPRVYLDYFEANIAQFGAEDFVVPVRKTSVEASLDFADESFDLVYLDGLHDYRSVLADLAAWLPKVKPGGILCGDDCECSLDRCIRAQVLESCELDHDPELVYLDEKRRVLKGGHPGVIRAVGEFFAGKATLGGADERQWSWRKPRACQTPAAS